MVNVNVEKNLPHYMMRRFVDKDAVEIANLFQMIYGNDYLDPRVYDPDYWMSGNRSGGLISVVASDPHGQIMGHVSAAQRNANAGIFEMAQGVVHPNARGHTVFTELLRQAVAAAEECPRCKLLYAEPVTNHTFTQGKLGELGFMDTGLLYGAVPSEMMAKQLQAPQPVSLIMQFRARKGEVHKDVYLPPKYRDISQSIFTSLDMPRTIHTRAGRQPQDIPLETEFSVTDKKTYGVREIHITQVGHDLHEKLAMIEIAGINEHFRIIHCFVDISCPDILNRFPDFHDLGFVFSAILPHWSGNDVLLLQKPLTGQKHFRPRINSAFGQSLLRHIEEELAEGGPELHALPQSPALHHLRIPSVEQRETAQQRHHAAA